MTDARVQLVSQKLDDLRRELTLAISCDAFTVVMLTSGIFEHVDDRRILVSFFASFAFIRIIFGCDNNPSL